jgi:hypothetical protein
VLSSFVLDNDSGSGTWTLEHRMELNRLWVRGARATQKDTPHIAVVDPLNAKCHAYRNHQYFFLNDRQSDREDE